MKVLLLLSFVFITPVVVFLSSILFEQQANILIKQELTKANVYSKVGEILENPDDQSTTDETEITNILTAVITPEYLQEKTESTIDQSYLWIIGKSDTAPRVELKEIKTSITTNYPDLLTTLETLPSELASSPEMMSDETLSPTESAGTEEIQQMTQMFSSLAKNDFTLPLEKNLIGIKQLYKQLQIAQPVLVIILIILLVGIILLSHTISEKLLWTGFTFLITGISGFVLIALSHLLQSGLSELLASNSTDVFRIISPIIDHISLHILNSFTRLQGIVSVALLILAALCFLAAELTKAKSQVKTVTPTPRKTK